VPAYVIYQGEVFDPAPIRGIHGLAREALMGYDSTPRSERLGSLRWCP
jgi:hypothetical protein